MTSSVSVTDSNNSSHQTLQLIIRNSSAVDDMVVKIDPMLYDAVVEAQSSSSGLGDAPRERQLPQIPPKLYNAVVKGNVEVLDDFLQPQGQKSSAPHFLLH